MSGVTEYNAKDCTITWGDIYITGLAEDMVSGSKNEDFFSESVGAQGDVVINEKNDPLGTVTIKVHGTCPQRKFLIADAKAGTIKPLWVNNKSLGRKFGGTQARIKNFPEETEGTELGDLEFVFSVFDYTTA